MPIDKMVVQNHVVMDEIATAAVRTSGLLLKASSELAYALGKQPFSCNTNAGGCKTYFEVNKKGRLKVESYHNNDNLDYIIKISPLNSNIILNVEGEKSKRKMAALLGGSGAVGLIADALMLSSGLFWPGCMGLTLIAPMATGAISSFHKWRFMQDYDPDTFFKNYNEFALRRGYQKAEGLLRDYLALPKSISAAIEQVTSKNSRIMKELESNQAEFNLLEERLR